MIKEIMAKIVAEVKGFEETELKDDFNILVSIKRGEVTEIKLELNKHNYWETLAERELIFGSIKQKLNEYVQMELDNRANAELERRNGK